MPVYDFACDCGEVAEARVGYGTSSLPCPACGRPASRSAVYQISLGKTEKKYRVSDVVEASQEMDYTASRMEQREGRPVRMPSPYKAGLRQAQKMGAKIRSR